ncbi:Uncharacterized protein Tcan_14717 [Toxocara canis]|uniref:Protein FAM151B n=1 Tax=Toxocara canis TaxID=6265 RepID=A0A0B2UUK6_TOXCA|nr:Uncharacterized protein Tcan_14717 [Toxocara canis]
MRRQFALTLFAAFLCIPFNSGYRTGARISTVDIWRNETDNGNVIVAHGINSWPALLEQLNEPILERSAVIEGDVLLYKQRKHRNRAIPLMSAPSKVADRITFKEWLREVAKLRKVIKINVRSTEAVRPVLQYLFAASDEITSPVVLHANVFRSPRSIEPTVDASEFVDGAKKYFPEATLSIGWTRNNISEMALPQRRIGWRELFQVLALIKDVEQSIMISTRLAIAAQSAEELSFVLGVRPTISVLVWSEETDTIDSWTSLIELRSGPHAKRLIFDLHPKHRTILKSLPYTLTFSESEFDRYHWRKVEFPSASLMPSGIVDSTDGVAFLGWPNSFLISLLQSPMFPSAQSISAQLTFVRKRNVRGDEDWIEKSGLAVYLPEKVLDIQSPEIDGGIKAIFCQSFFVFIGYNGRISIENRDKDLLDRYYQSRTIGQLQKADCYAFELIDRGWRIELSAWIRSCEDDALYGRTDINLETPVPK